MSKKMFTHVDLDGIGCAILAKIAYGDEIDIEFVNYNDVNEKVLSYLENEYKGFCYITDISVNEEVASKIEEINSITGKTMFKLIDHHKTAEWLNKYSWAKIESEREGRLMSGTNLFYEHIKEDLPEGADGLIQFVELVRSYDTWDWTKTDNQMAKNLNDVLYIIGRDDFINDYTAKLGNLFDAVEDFEIVDLHMALLKYKRKEIELYINKKMEQVKVIDRVALVVADSNISELGNKICETIDCDYCAIYTGQNISMRSVGNYDVSIIAKQNNGGGHKNASGMPCVGVEKVFELFKIKEIEEKALLNKKIQDIELKLIGIKTENEALKQIIETMSTFTHTHAEE